MSLNPETLQPLTEAQTLALLSELQDEAVAKGYYRYSEAYNITDPSLRNGFILWQRWVRDYTKHLKAINKQKILAKAVGAVRDLLYPGELALSTQRRVETALIAVGDYFDSRREA